MEKNEKKQVTEVFNLIILDKSGSMSCIADAARTGFNETVGGIRAAQEKYPDTQRHYVSLMVFCNCEKKMLWDKTPVADVKELTSKDYRPCCGTPLYDAMGISLNALYSYIKDRENATAMVTVITDGYENASREYSGRTIKALIEKLKNEEGWNFAYMGANQDVDAVSFSLSIDHKMEFDYDEEGARKAFLADRKARMTKYDNLQYSLANESAMSIRERKLARAKRNMEEKYFQDEDDTKGENK